MWNDYNAKRKRTSPILEKIHSFAELRKAKYTETHTQIQPIISNNISRLPQPKQYQTYQYRSIFYLVMLMNSKMCTVVVNIVDCSLFIVIVIAIPYVERLYCNFVTRQSNFVSRNILSTFVIQKIVE